jgi:PTH1 family peptidyl-tRNA hydrolase
MLLVFGLGNKGLKYNQTRHNFGFLLADKLIEAHQLQSKGTKFGGQIFLGKITDQQIILIKPQDYMNNSGSCVLSASRFYKIHPNNIIVLHDDLDLNLGRIKAKVGGGNAGHNGLKDIDDKIGKDYCRIRLGILNKFDGASEALQNYNISSYVLGKFGKQELEMVEEINQIICKIFYLAIKKDLPNFLNQFSNYQNNLSLH